MTNVSPRNTVQIRLMHDLPATDAGCARPTLRTKPRCDAAQRLLDSLGLVLCLFVHARPQGP
jgi:hypothetical protein